VTRQREESPFAPAIEAASARLGVTALLDRRAGGLSGGQQRKVAVLLGLARAPGLLLLDEATTNLDEAARATTWELIREYAARGGSALVTSHILADIEAHADRLVALNRGRVVAEAPLGQLRERLGGSIVSVRVSAEQRSALADAIAARVCESRLAEPAAALPADAPLRWRTRTPMPLVAALAELAPDARDLQVLPIPLGELLQALAEVPVG
jgi:ABC-2 type transport system ATP-binding protein